MLAPALLYKEQLIHKFAEHLYTKDYFYYNGYPCGSQLPNIREDENTYQYVIIDKDKNIVGYFSYQIYTLTDCVCNFGLYSFDKGNPLVGIDVYRKLKELMKIHHRIEWRVIEGNPVTRHYNKFCERNGGYKVYLHDCTKDEDGRFHGEYIYEIINKER